MDDRKLKILAAVVDEYIVTGEPVGSKAIAALPDINVSAATIRNDMAMLEQLGYLEQPHTSAGRVPTYNGYRLYIDKLMKTHPLSDEEKKLMDGFLMNSDGTEDGLIESASKALAELTQCAAVVSNASPQFSVISKVEVVPTGKRLYVLLLITSSGSIKNKVCRLEFDLSKEQLDFFTEFMAENLQGVRVDDLSDELVERLIVATGTYMMTLTPLIQGVYELARDLLGRDVHLSGEKNLLTRQDIDKMQLVRFMENKNDVTRILDDSFSGIHVMFSEEDDSFVISNSSMIVSKYQKGDRTAGSLGIIGPMRLDYAKIIPYIEYFTEKITEMISEENDDENDEN